MSDKSAIQWTDATWNATVGCSIVSPGCTHCYAMRVAHGLERRFGSTKYGGLTKVVNGNAVWTGQVRLDEAALLQPLKWKRPRRIFVNSMSDLFHESLSDEDIDKVFAVMALCPQHTFQVLTKRAKRMREYLTKQSKGQFQGSAAAIRILGEVWRIQTVIGALKKGIVGYAENGFPLPNVWLGVSCERQQEAGERIPDLLETPAAVRFISAEPLLGPIDLQAIAIMRDRPEKMWPDWVIVGGESGKDSRPMHIEWADNLVAQCAIASVACFVKQLGAAPSSDGYPLELRDSKGGDWNEWPERLRVREFPGKAT